MSKDVNSLLNDLKAPDTVDWDKYQGPGEGFTPPPQPKDEKGNYIRFRGRAPRSFEFEATKDEKLLMAVIDPITIVSGSAAGYEIRYTRASVKKFEKRDGTVINASMLGNYLHAVDKNLRPQGNGEYIRAVEFTAGREFDFSIDWEAYDKTTQRTVAEKYEDFPLVDPTVPALGRSPYITLPDGRRLVARARVKSFLSPAED